MKHLKHCTRENETVQYNYVFCSSELVVEFKKGKSVLLSFKGTNVI